MTGDAELREAWECSACSVASRRPEVGAVPMPEGWELDGEGIPKCLACVRRDDPQYRAGGRAQLARENRREQAIEAGEVKDAEVRALLIAHPDPHAASTIREVSAATEAGRERVTTMRRVLVAEGQIGPPPEKGAAKPPAAPPRRDEEKARRAEAALREDHRRPDTDVARAAGISKRIVARVRGELGLKWDARYRGREEARAVLVRLGEVPIESVAAELGVEHETARQRLDALVVDGRAAKRPDPAGRGRTARRLYRVAD